MKVTAKQTSPAFKPIEITIKLESDSELNSISTVINVLRRVGHGTFASALAQALDNALEDLDDQ